jgi:hypothetical protein
MTDKEMLAEGMKDEKHTFRAACFGLDHFNATSRRWAPKRQRQSTYCAERVSQLDRHDLHEREE